MASTGLGSASVRSRGAVGGHGGGTLRQRLAFLKEFLDNPGQVGAIAPSSRFLARRMAGGLAHASIKAVVEYGPGTGVVTRAILERIPKGCKYLAIERSAELVRLFRQRFPGITIYEDTAANVQRLCRKNGIDAVDTVVSGLPWAVFPEPLQDEILAATVKVLRPGGEFVTFGYHVGLLTPAGRRFHKKLPRYFSSVRRDEVVWRNMPPAFVCRCKK
jgi:phosphatidylethanolamine/phosphatidyl-N-methylethanolamine N-methyltransferase